MENAKKMLLVEPSVLERMKYKENAPENSLSRLDKEMKDILNKKLQDPEKWKLYLQTLQRYLYFASEERQPLKLSLISDEDGFSNNNEVYKEQNVKTQPLLTQSSSEVKDTISPPSTFYSSSYLMRLVPKTFKKKGELLIKTLIENNDKIRWDSQGTVIINDKAIPGSNIVDLISDTLRQLKRPKPRGWEQFSQLLTDIRIPLICIGNPTTLEYVRKLNIEKFKEISPTGGKQVLHTNSTPKSSTKELKARKLEWERWTPY